jgi:hypothetical protein
MRYIEPALASREALKKQFPLTNKERSEAWKATYGSRELSADFAAHRVEKFNLTILPDLIANEIFELVPMEEGQRIEIDKTYSAEYEVSEITAHGNRPQKSWVLKDTVAMYDPYRIKTDKIHYPINSVIQGNISKSDEVNGDLEFSLRSEVDSDAWTLFTGIFDTFTENAVYRLHSRVNSSNIPTTNIVDASSEGALTLGAMKLALAHCAMAGIIPRIFYVSPQDIADTWDWTPVVAGYSGGDKVKAVDVLSQEKFGQLMQSGKINDLFGYPVIFRTVNTLASGKVYMSSNKPAGKLYYWPSRDKVRYWSEDECAKIDGMPEYEAVQMENQIKPLIPEPLYLNSVRIDLT